MTQYAQSLVHWRLYLLVPGVGSGGSVVYGLREAISILYVCMNYVRHQAYKGS